MKLIIQRVSEASVSVNNGPGHGIGRGLVILFGAGSGDQPELADKLAYKAANLRIFPDGEGKMNLSAAQLGLEILAVPNFTLYADTKKGLRPSFADAAGQEIAEPAFRLFVAALKALPGLGDVQQGEFGADMKLALVNDGPVTIVMEH